MTMPDPVESDLACADARGETGSMVPAESDDRTLVAVFASPVADHLLRFGADLGFRCLLLEPDGERAEAAAAAGAGRPSPPGLPGPPVLTALPEDLGDAGADVVVTDHDRPELGVVLRDLLARPVPVRWIGVMGSPRHPAPHIPALTDLGVPEDEIARVHRPIGLNIGSRTPAEIALATMAGLIADRNRRPGGFVF